MAVNAIDYRNARLLKVEYDGDPAVARQGKCTIFQFSDTLMTSRQILDWIWQPRPESPVTYMGPQCLSEEQQNVLGFKGIDTEGIPWQTFFDKKTKLAVKGFSGSGDPEEGGSTRIELTVDKHQVISDFKTNDAEFYPFECLKDYQFEVIDQSMMPIVDFGLLFL